MQVYVARLLFIIVAGLVFLIVAHIHDDTTDFFCKAVTGIDDENKQELRSNGISTDDVQNCRRLTRLGLWVAYVSTLIF